MHLLLLSLYEDGTVSVSSSNGQEEFFDDADQDKQLLSPRTPESREVTFIKEVARHEGAISMIEKLYERGVSDYLHAVDQRIRLDLREKVKRCFLGNKDDNLSGCRARTGIVYAEMLGLDRACNEVPPTVGMNHDHQGTRRTSQFKNTGLLLIYEEWDPDQSLSVNTILSGPLISRFDIVLVHLDKKKSRLG
ncbi:hypothetical protein Tco_0714915 [Tanacetum coccineum]